MNSQKTEVNDAGVCHIKALSAEKEGTWFTQLVTVDEMCRLQSCLEAVSASV